MIHAVLCDQPKFRKITFQAGFNVVLATRTLAATDKDSRNGAGKSTLVEIVHFCLGAKADKSSRLMATQLRDWTFSLDLDLRGKRYRVSRNTSSAKKVFLEGDFSEWPIKPKLAAGSSAGNLSVNQWNELLGWLLFELPPQNASDTYEPSFRSLLSYFVRRGRDSFSIPFEHHRKQAEWDKQVQNAFLLGMYWEYPARLQTLKDQEKVIVRLKEAIKAGTFPELLGTVGELESQKVLFEERIARRAEELKSFRVHPQYLQIQEHADALQSSIRRLNQENATDRAMLSFYEESLVREAPPDVEKLSTIYKEAGVAWPQTVRQRLEDVRQFHEKVIVNRRTFLDTEILRLASSVAERDESLRKLSDERAESLSILNTHGALAEFSEIQRLQNEETAKLGAVNQRIANLKRIEVIKSRMRIERENLQVVARKLYDERRVQRERAISLFNEFSQALYSRAGELIVDVVPTGYRFNVEIARHDSQGVEQMKVFLYDLALASLWSEKKSGPGFLIHDSTIFADVDERQKAHALELAEKMSRAFGFQYICCLNSDAVPEKDFSDGFSLQRYVRIELTDADETGGLLGIRY